MMIQSYDTRGRLAFIADQVEAAIELFKTNEIDDCEKVLRSVAVFIDELLGGKKATRQ